MLLEWIVKNNINCSQLARSQMWCQKENTIIFYDIKYKSKNKMQRVQEMIFFCLTCIIKLCNGCKNEENL
jgi:hypothetical protein